MTGSFDMAGAACQGYPTGWWYATGSATDAALARQICTTCPIVDPCRTAGRIGREWGIWGGETQEARARAGYAPANVTNLAGRDIALDDTPLPPGCGTHANYGYGCRCDACKKAYRRVERKRRRDEAKIRDLRRSIGRPS